MTVQKCPVVRVVRQLPAAYSGEAVVKALQGLRFRGHLMALRNAHGGLAILLAGEIKFVSACYAGQLFRRNDGSLPIRR